MKQFPLLFFSTLAVCHLGCKTQSKAALQEGFAAADQRTVEQIVERLIQVQKRPMPQHLINSLLTHLPRLIRSTIQISCGEGELQTVGTGVLIDNECRFLTAAHVLNTDERGCRIKVTDLDAKGGVFAREFTADIKIEDGRLDQNHDFAVGQIQDRCALWSVDWVEDYDPKSIQGHNIVSLGFPGVMDRRIQASEEVKIAQEVVNYDLLCDGRLDEIIEFRASAMTDEEREIYFSVVGSTSAQSTADDKFLLSEYCRHLREQRGRNLSDDYDIYWGGSADPTGLYINVGQVLGSYKNSIFATNDIMHGMSGGPVFDLNTGQLVGLSQRYDQVDTTGTLSEPAQIQHVPVSIVTKVTAAMARQVRAEKMEMFDSCYCHVDARTNYLFFFSRKVASYNWLACLPKEFPGKENFCRSLEGLQKSVEGVGKVKNVTLETKKCYPLIQIRAPQCVVLPKAFVRAYRNGKYLGAIQSSLPDVFKADLISGLPRAVAEEYSASLDALFRIE